MSLEHKWLDHERKWRDGTLTREEIRDRIEVYCDEVKIGLLPVEIDHVARIIHRMYRKYHNPKEYVGDFIRALAEDSYKKLCNLADSKNRRALYLYHYYLYNNAMRDWREKMLA